MVLHCHVTRIDAHLLVFHLKFLVICLHLHVTRDIASDSAENSVDHDETVHSRISTICLSFSPRQ